MAGATISFGPSLKALNKADWLDEVNAAVKEHGRFSELGKRHWSMFTEGTSTLLVTFETVQGIQALSSKAHPLGWDLVAEHGWSHLGLISDGDTWFRDQDVYAFFDEMVDDAFFDQFDHVVFYGAGSCGYAAAAFSVVAPGARVLAIQPQATLDPRIAGWDNRFLEQRRTCFTDRYGYAPDMLEAAGRAYIIYAPQEREDAMHAALFTRPNVTKLRLNNMGGALQVDLLQMGLIQTLIDLSARGRLTPQRFAALARARRDHLPYLRRVLARLEVENRQELKRILCHNVNRRMRPLVLRSV